MYAAKGLHDQRHHLVALIVACVVVVAPVKGDVALACRHSCLHYPLLLWSKGGGGGRSRRARPRAAAGCRGRGSQASSHLICGKATHGTGDQS
jgi:hypothetical protein